MEQKLFVSYDNLLVFVGLDGYTPQKGVYCYPGIAKMNAKNLSSARQECLTNTDCTMFTDQCGDGDFFSWCGATGVPQTSTCNSVTYLKNN